MSLISARLNLGNLYFRRAVGEHDDAAPCAAHRVSVEVQMDGSEPAGVEGKLRLKLSLAAEMPLLWERPPGRGRLPRELSKRDTGKTLYILDEPTTGLHFEDIKQLLEVLHRLRNHGNTVVIIEHNLDVIKTADWIVDLGPEGGSGGGRIIATGTPEEVAKSKGSFTGHFLAPMLKRKAGRHAA